jgi:hypothetical protein
MTLLVTPTKQDATFGPVGFPSSPARGMRGVGPADAGQTRPRFDLSPHHEAGANGDRRRWPSVNGADDLAAVDATEVDAGDPEVGVPELALYHDEGNALVRHLDGVSAPQLMRCEPARNAGREPVTTRPDEMP